MTKGKTSCCSGGRKRIPATEMDLPGPIREEIEQMGGFEALAGRVPAKKELEEKGRVYHALADPLRLAILYLIRDQPLCVCVIKKFVGIGDSKLSYHLGILKESGLVEGNYHGNWIIYSLTEQGKKFAGQE